MEPGARYADSNPRSWVPTDEVSSRAALAQVGHVMGYENVRSWSGAVACLALLACPASAEKAPESFQVVVTVPARVALEIVAQPAALTLTQGDLVRGYIDVPGRYHVSHNDRRGYLLQFVPVAGIARQVEVRGLGGAFVLAADAVEVHRPGDSFEQDVALEFRIVLAEGARPGTFNWPVRLTALPI